VAGVCGGLGRYLGVDPVLLRVAFVILTVAGGSGLLIYVLAWILIPEERSGDALGPVPSPRAMGSASGQVVLGTVLIAIGTILLVNRFVPWFDKVVGPAVLILLGLGVLLWTTRR
jgi:phage shock protein C